jgi:phosphoribosylaminoimidazolecarboxamide formyltransferase/IMP cyclohydrolase
MATIEYVSEIDDLVQLKTILVSCTDKCGLVNNRAQDGTTIAGIPPNGLLGYIAHRIPDVLFISTGGTYQLLKKHNLPVIEVSEVTKFPEMETGLVKSLHPAIHAGILAHRYTKSDDLFMKKQEIRYIDALIVNFYALHEVINDNRASFEIVRQAIDVGGPSMSHNARKAFISTALITDPATYPALIDELEKHNGSVSLKTRLSLVKTASKMINNYLNSVDDYIQRLDISDLEKCYKIH